MTELEREATAVIEEVSRTEVEPGEGTEFAQEHGIGLLSLPPYAPNLNLLERFWKLVKAQVLNVAYSRDV